YKATPPALRRRLFLIPSSPLQAPGYRGIEGRDLSGVLFVGGPPLRRDFGMFLAASYFCLLAQGIFPPIQRDTSGDPLPLLTEGCVVLPMLGMQKETHDEVPTVGVYSCCYDSGVQRTSVGSISPGRRRHDYARNLGLLYYESGVVGQPQFR